MAHKKPRDGNVYCQGRLGVGELLKKGQQIQISAPCQQHDGQPVAMLPVDPVPHTWPVKMVYKCPMCGTKITE